MLLVAVTTWAQSSLTIENALGTLNNGQYSWTSEKMTLPEGATKLRLTFVESYDNASPAGFPYVCISEFYLYDADGNAVNLVEEKFSSNATHNGEGRVAALCDGITTGDANKYDWYWHSQWGGTPSPYGYHYLEVDITSIENLDTYSFGWVTRRAQGAPKKVVVSTGASTAEAAKNANSQMLPKVSTDFVHVYTIVSSRSKKYLTYSENNAKPQQNQNVTEAGYWYFTQGSDGKVVMHNIASGKVLGANFEMATEGEWFVSPAGYRPGIVFSKTDDVTKNNCIDDQSGSIGSWSHNAGDEEGTTWLVKEVSGVSVTMLSLPGKKIASIGEAVTEVTDGWYILNNVGRGNYVSQEGDNWKMRATNNVAVGNIAVDKAGYLFKITKNGDYYNIVSGNCKYFKLGSNSASTSANPVKFSITNISGNNFCLFDTENGYAADGQASGENFVGWANSVPTSAGGNDSYRLLPVEFATVSEVEILTLDLTEAIAAAQTQYNAIKDYIGEGVGKYTAPANFEAQFAAIVAFRDAIDANTTIADIEAKIAELAALVAGFSLNMPEAGKYYRIAYNFNGTLKYVQGVASGAQDKSNGMLISEEEGAASIFYFDGGKLLSYTAGTYVKEDGGVRGLQAVGTAGAVTFEAGSAIGTIAVKAPNYMHANTHNGIDFVDHCGGAGCAQHNFIIEEVESLPVSISAAKYATFYAPVAVNVAEGVEAYNVTVDDASAVLTKIESGVIPANTGVVLTGSEATYNFEITTADAFEGENLMAGTIAKTLVAKEENKEYYVLSNGSNGVGLYVAVNGEDDTTFYNSGHKAYLAVDKNVAGEAKSFGLRIPGTTGISEVECGNGNVKAIYDLTGRKVETISAPGIYIIGGKKTLVK